MQSIMSMDSNISWYHPAMNDVNLRFGEWLSDRLYEHDNMTQSELAHRLGVDQSTVSGWITDPKKRPRRKTCWRIADFFGWPRAEVIKLAGYKPSALDEREPSHLKVLEPTHTNVSSLPSGRADYYGEQEIRQIARSVVEEMEGFVAIRIIGYVPADTTRWASWEHEDRAMPFERELLGSRSPDQFYVLIASGDCMVARNIPNGAAVLIRELDPGERPQHDDIVVVRVGDEYTLKVWSIEDGRTCLRDGDGNLIIELDDADDVHVLGIAIYSRIDLRGR